TASAALSEIGAPAGLGGIFRDVQPGFPGVETGTRRAIRAKFENLPVAGHVARPLWQTGSVRIAVLSEVDPVTLRHSGDRQVFWRWRAAPACCTRAEHVGDLAAVRGPLHPLPHRCLDVGEPVQIDGCT